MRFAATRPARRTGFPLLLLIALVVSAASAPREALALEITTTSLSDATAGVSYSSSVVAANGTTPYVWSLESGSLPSGISLDPDTGALTGTATLAEMQAFIVHVQDAVGDTATRPLSITVAAGDAAALTYEQQPGTIVAGTAFSPALAVSVRDAFGNLVSTATDEVSLAVTAGTGSLAGTVTVNAIDGVATFGALTIEAAGTGKQLTASSGGLTPAVSASFDVTAGAATALAYEQQPGTIVAGAAFSPALAVSVRDAFGNLVSSATDEVSLAVTAGTGSLVGTVTVNAIDGVATFGALTIEAAGTGKQVTGSSGGLTPAVSSSFDVTVGAAAAVAYEQQPGTIVAGAAFSPALAVSVRDAFGNLVSSATDEVSLAVTAGTGSLVGTVTVNAIDGVATFGALTIEAAGVGKQITASSGGLTPAVSSSFDVTGGAATALAYEQQPGTIVAGTPFSPALVVTVRDAFGNLVSTATDEVSLAVTTGTGSLVGTATVNAIDGVATFGALTIEAAGVGKQLTASSGALTPALSASFDVTASAATALAYDQQPGTIVAGTPFSPALAVSVRDAFGNLVSTATDEVSLAVTSGTGSLVGTTTVNAVSGVANFGALTIGTAGTGKQLTASSGVLTPAVSTSFNVTTGTAAALSFTQQPGAVLVGATITPAVKVRATDAFGNGVSGELVGLSLVGNGTLAGGASVATDANGEATFAALTVNREGSKQLSATTGSLGPVLSDPFAVSCPAITLTPLSPTLPGGISSTPYSQSIGASGGASPYSFAVTAGALPTGITLSSGGLLSGTPTVDGTFGFTITAIDADSCLGSQAYSLFLCPVIAVLPASAPSASIGVAYSQTFTASAGSAPFTFAVTSGTLPTGLSLSAGGLLSGTPTATGTFPFTIGITAAAGCTGSRAYSIDVLGIPAAVTNLAATRVASGNDGDGTTKIQVTFTMPPGGAVAEVYRAPFGHYPQYDDAGGAVPVTPGYPPNAPWSLTAVTASGQTDEPATRDFYHYVVFTKNAGGGVSPVSNKTGGTGNYALGDVSDGVDAGTGNNLVGTEDISLLGANYGINAAEIVSRGVPYLDVGPTHDFQISSRPFTDKRIDFEDLIVFATNFGATSAPQLAANAAEDASGEPEQFQVQAPSLVEAGQVVTAVLHMQGGGRIQGFSAALAWDASVVEPVESTFGDFIEQQGGVTLSPRPGTVDAALLGVRGSGISGEGDVARVTFRAKRQGDAAIRLGDVIARDATNRALPIGAIAQATQADAPARTLMFSPWPNPTPGNATLSFALARPGNVELAVYSVDGRRVRTVTSGWREAGVYREIWKADDDERRAVAPGVYFVRLTADGNRFTKRIVHIR